MNMNTEMKYTGNKYEAPMEDCLTLPEIPQAMSDLANELGRSNELVETLWVRLKDVLADYPYDESDAGCGMTECGSPLAREIRNRCINVEDINEKLATIIERLRL